MALNLNPNLHLNLHLNLNVHLNLGLTCNLNLNLILHAWVGWHSTRIWMPRPADEPRGPRHSQVDGARGGGSISVCLER